MLFCIFVRVNFITFTADFQANISWKKAKSYLSQKYAKHCFNYELTLALLANPSFQKKNTLLKLRKFAFFIFYNAMTAQKRKTFFLGLWILTKNHFRIPYETNLPSCRFLTKALQLQIEIHLKDQVLHNLARVLYKLAEFGASVKCYQKIAALGLDHLISFRRTVLRLYDSANKFQPSKDLSSKNRLYTHHLPGQSESEITIFGQKWWWNLFNICFEISPFGKKVNCVTEFVILG